MSITPVELMLYRLSEQFVSSDQFAEAVFEVGGPNGLDFFSFNNLFETFMGAVSNNVMNMSRIQCSMHVDFGERDSLVYVQTSRPVWYNKIAGTVRDINIGDKGVKCWFLSPAKQCKSFPHVKPSSVSLQRQWIFRYKQIYKYVLVQSHGGSSKNQALCSVPKYWFRLHVSKYKNIDVDSLSKSVYLKLNDVLRTNYKEKSNDDEREIPMSGVM
jgi:hypothetical protein